MRLIWFADWFYSISRYFAGRLYNAAMNLRRSPILISLGALVIAAALPQTTGEPVRRPLRLEAPVQDKNFYLLSLIERTPAAAQALQIEPALRVITRNKRAVLAKALPAC